MSARPPKLNDRIVAASLHRYVGAPPSLCALFLTSSWSDSGLMRTHTRDASRDSEHLRRVPVPSALSSGGGAGAVPSKFSPLRFPI